MKKKKLVILTVLAALAAMILFGCGGAKAADFTSKSGITVTATDKWQQLNTAEELSELYTNAVDSEMVDLALKNSTSYFTIETADCTADVADLKDVVAFLKTQLADVDEETIYAQLENEYGAEIVGGSHIRMPDSICDVKLLKRSPEQNLKIIRTADRKIEKCAEGIRNGIYPKDGLFFYDRIAGLLGQRLWYCRKTKNYSDKLKISNVCTGCGLCTQVCPMENLALKNGKAAAGKHCTMCYRCISLCPAKAITLLGCAVIEQCRYDKYVKRR